MFCFDVCAFLFQYYCCITATKFLVMKQNYCGKPHVTWNKGEFATTVTDLYKNDPAVLAVTCWHIFLPIYGYDSPRIYLYSVNQVWMIRTKSVWTVQSNAFYLSMICALIVRSDWLRPPALFSCTVWVKMLIVMCYCVGMKF